MLVVHFWFEVENPGNPAVQPLGGILDPLTSFLEVGPSLHYSPVLNEEDFLFS